MACTSFINSFPQFRITKAILWLLEYKRKEFPNNPVFHVLFRTEVIEKAKVNYQNFSDFIEKLREQSIILLIPIYNDPDSWGAFIVTESGESKLKAEIESYGL